MASYNDIDYDPEPEKKLETTEEVGHIDLQLQKFKTYSPWGIRREGVVAAYMDVLGIENSANLGSPFNTVEVALMMPFAVTKTSDNKKFRKLIRVENGTKLTIPKGSILHEIAVWKNTDADLDPNLTIALGFDVFGATRKETKEFFKNRICPESKPLQGSILSVNNRWHRSLKIGVEYFTNLRPFLQAEWKEREKNEFPEIDLERLEVDDQIGEHFTLEPMYNVISGKLNVKDLGFSIKFSPPVSN